MNTRAMTAEEIRRAGLAALSGSLGPAGTIRFLQQFQGGKGDYTAERRRILGTSTLDDLLRKRPRARRTGKRRRPAAS